MCVSVLPTLWKARWVVINVGDDNGDRGGARETAQLARHVCRLDDKLVAVLRLTVQTRHRRQDDP